MPATETARPVPTFLLAKVAEVSAKFTVSPEITPALARVAASVVVASYTLFAPDAATVIASLLTV